MRKILFLILVLFIISSVSAVCAANTTNDLIKTTSDKSIDLSSINDNTYKHVENSNDVLLKSYSSNNELAKINPENKLDQQQQQQQEPPKSDNNSFIVKKYWEGNYSGSINEIEIQLLKKLNPNNENPPVPELCPPKCKSSYSDNNDLDFLADAVGDIVILPDINGVLTSYKIIKTVKLTKENNWTYVFKNLTFSSARLNGTNHWYLGDAGEYIVREINTPSNVQVIGSSFVKYFTCPVDGGLKVFWNLTNRIPKTEYNTTPLNETNENVTTPINITDEAFYEENEDVYVPDKEDNQVTNSSSIYSSPTHENKINTENATGNPIFVLFMIMILSGIVTLRRKE